jgi:hypothetical protein
MGKGRGKGEGGQTLLPSATSLNPAPRALWALYNPANFATQPFAFFASFAVKLPASEKKATGAFGVRGKNDLRTELEWW